MENTSALKNKLIALNGLSKLYLEANMCIQIQIYRNQLKGGYELEGE